MISRPLILISALGVAALSVSGCSLIDQAATQEPPTPAVQVNDSPSSAIQQPAPQAVAQARTPMEPLQGLQIGRVSFHAFENDGYVFCAIDLDFPENRVRVIARPFYDWQGIFYFQPGGGGEPLAEYAINQKTGELDLEDAYLHEGLKGSFILKMAQMNYEQCAL